MIKYNWKEINNTLNWNSYYVCIYFYLREDLKIPKFLIVKLHKKLVEFSKEKYPEGNSFIINIQDLLLNVNNALDLYIYLQLASKRSIFDYNIRGITYLPKELLEEYEYTWAIDSPLIDVKDNNVYFKYEQEKQ